jgi:hypothetical protein
LDAAARKGTPLIDLRSQAAACLKNSQGDVDALAKNSRLPLLGVIIRKGIE